MEWTEDKYGTTVEVCDSQHRELFDRVNALNEAVSNGERTDVGKRLDYLIEYVVEHFEDEERLMEEKNYDGLAAHRVEHSQLVDTCTDLQQKFHAGEANIEDATMMFIKNWLDHHIPVIDKSYGPTLSA
jgi:hemerythrin